jgi:hypothetical protein
VATIVPYLAFAVISFVVAYMTMKPAKLLDEKSTEEQPVHESTSKEEMETS